MKAANNQFFLSPLLLLFRKPKIFGRHLSLTELQQRKRSAERGNIKSQKKKMRSIKRFHLFTTAVSLRLLYNPFTFSYCPTSIGNKFLDNPPTNPPAPSPSSNPPRNIFLPCYYMGASCNRFSILLVASSSSSSSSSSSGSDSRFLQPLSDRFQRSKKNFLPPRILLFLPLAPAYINNRWGQQGRRRTW